MLFMFLNCKCILNNVILYTKRLTAFIVHNYVYFFIKLAYNNFFFRVAQESPALGLGSSKSHRKRSYTAQEHSDDY